MNGRESLSAGRDATPGAMGLTNPDFDPAKGKGSHGTVYVGEYETQVQHGEIAIGTLMSMLRELNIEQEGILNHEIHIFLHI